MHSEIHHGATNNRLQKRGSTHYELNMHSVFKNTAYYQQPLYTKCIVQLKKPCWWLFTMMLI